MECVPHMVDERRRYFEKQKQLKAEAEKFMADNGTTLDELMSLFESAQQKQKKKPASPAKAAYRMPDGKGGFVTWSGRGRMPEAFRKLVADAGSREALEKWRVHEDEGGGAGNRLLPA